MLRWLYFRESVELFSCVRLEILFSVIVLKVHRRDPHDWKLYESVGVHIDHHASPLLSVRGPLDHCATARSRCYHGASIYVFFSYLWLQTSVQVGHLCCQTVKTSKVATIKILFVFFSVFSGWRMYTWLTGTLFHTCRVGPWFHSYCHGFPHGKTK